MRPNEEVRRMLFTAGDLIKVFSRDITIISVKIL
jgi:hypothetical protein